MTLQVGSNSIGEIYFGSQAISEVYKGSDLIWSASVDVPQFVFRDIDSNGKLTYATGALESTADIKQIKDYGLSYAFYNCSGLTNTEVNFTNLTSIGKDGLERCFYKCLSITTVRFSALKKVSWWSFYNCFDGCANLTDIYFNSLTSNSFNSSAAFTSLVPSGKTIVRTIHFPSNLESTVSGLSDYPNFGGSSGYVTLAFDLPATS